MPIGGIALGTGLGGGTSATSSGAPGGGGCPPYSNTLSGSFSADFLTMSPIDITGAKACSLWVRASTQMMAGGATLIGNSNSSKYIMYIFSGRYMYSRDLGGYGPQIDFGAGAFTLNTWAHICISSDGTTSTYYLDGVEKATTANKEFVATANIGAGATSYPHNNLLDEIALWDSELTADQVTNIFKGEEDGGSGGTPRTPGDLCSFAPLHWWQFGNGPGDVNAAGGTPANLGAIGTLVDQGSGGKNASNTTGSGQPAFSNVLPS